MKSRLFLASTELRSPNHSRMREFSHKVRETAEPVRRHRPRKRVGETRARPHDSVYD
jgi:hypothetical protein